MISELENKMAGVYCLTGDHFDGDNVHLEKYCKSWALFKKSRNVLVITCTSKYSSNPDHTKFKNICVSEKWLVYHRR